MSPSGGLFRFGDHELDLATRSLRRRDGTKVPLQEKPFTLLAVLVARAPHVVEREELARQLWGEGTFVDVDHGLNTAVRKLRDALGDDAHEPRFIETVARHGYRFACPVEMPPETAPEAAAAPRRALWFGAAPFVALALLLVASVGARVAKRLEGAHRPAGPVIRSIAVLPLANLSGDPSQEYFADGMTEALITELARAGAWRVTSRTSVMAFKGKPIAVPEIARQLDVDAVVEGTVERSADRVRVTAQLIDARADRHLWADTFDRQAADVLLLQSEVAAAVTREVRLNLRPSPAARRADPVDPAAYDAYLLGRYFWNKRTAEGFSKALEAFDRATRLDPNWALGWAGLADTYGLMAISTYDLVPPAEAMPKARAAAQRAVELDPELAEPHASLGWVNYTYDWDFVSAEREFRRAIELDPNYATAHQWYASFLCAMGRIDEARAEIGEALTLDPLSLVINNEAAWPDYYARSYDQSDSHYRRTLELEPNYAVAHLELGTSLAVRHRWAEALAEFERYAAVAGRDGEALGFMSQAAAGLGERAKAVALRDELITRSRSVYVPSHALAVADLGLGDTHGALAALEQAYERREDAVLYLAVDPLFDSLHPQPRFQSLLRRIRLPAAALEAAGAIEPSPRQTGSAPR